MKEVQVYTRVNNRWSGDCLQIEVRYLPSVYTAKATIYLTHSLSSDERTALEQTVLNIFEERLKADFKRQLEATEEISGFLESGSLVKLSACLSRYMLRVLANASCKWDIAID
ncbi:MAG: hypothetical protein CMR00_06420 [[Chlorobium] sp. 445]|nr:MAG: hypothetical protein CMR00_06420 [[Chlorobium] sp. 445]